MKIILFMLIIRKVIKTIRKIVKNHQNIENLKFIKSAFKIRNALNQIFQPIYHLICIYIFLLLNNLKDKIILKNQIPHY